jgi:hypothetical protein
MLWLIPFLLFLLFILFRFVKTHQESVIPRPSFIPWWNTDSIDDTKQDIDEGFATLMVSDEFKQKYKSFSDFYNGFMIRWRDALVTAYQLQKEAGKADSTIPPDSVLQGLVTKMVTEQGKPLPPLSEPLFGVATLEDLEGISERIPKDSQPFFNALEWMNGQLLKAQKEVEAALQGQGIPSFEGFEGGTCSELSKCFKDNPELVRQLLKAQQEDQAQRLERLQRELISRFEQFQQPRIKNAYELNVRLSKQAKEMQDKAQSGDWIKDVKMGGKDDGPSYSVPEGGNQLEELRKKDPAAYNSLQSQNKSMFSLKQLFEQINANLR